MHEPFVPACSHCSRFVRSFPTDSPLAEWGFCAAPERPTVAGPEVLRRVEEAARAGDFAPVLGLPGLFQEGDDGCEAFHSL